MKLYTLNLLLYGDISYIQVTFENQYYNIYDSTDQFVGYANSSYDQYLTINVYR